MIEFLEFKFSGDTFYTQETTLPLSKKGLILLRGKNYDASNEGHYTSNGAGKTRLIEMLPSFIYGRSARGTLKKMVSPEFNGSLKLKIKDDVWEFSYTPKKSVDSWTILKNQTPVKVSHKASDCLDMLQKVVNLSREDFNYFVFINQQSLNTLIRGKPAEKKVYLEGFFNIDNFYATKFESYNRTWKTVKTELDILKIERAKLDNILLSLKEFSGHEYLKLQLESCDELLQIIKYKIDFYNKNQALVLQQLTVWRQYQESYTKIQGLDGDDLRMQLTSLTKERYDLEVKFANLNKVKVLLRTKIDPHFANKPKRFGSATPMPTKERPNANILVEKKVAYNQMQEKLAIKKQIRSLEHEISSIDTTTLDIQQIDNKRVNVLKERSVLTEHFHLLKNNTSICPTCKQPLTFLLEGKSLKEQLDIIVARLKELKSVENECNELSVLSKRTDKLTQNLEVLKDRFNKYPTYGIKLSDAAADVARLIELDALWSTYEDEQRALKDWQVAYDLLIAEAKSLGFPSILQDNDIQSKLNDIDVSIRQVSEDLKLLDLFNSLAEQLLLLPDISTLEYQDVECRECLQALLGRLGDVNEYKGVLKEQLSSLALLTEQRLVLEEKVSTQSDLEKEAKLLEVINTFYSPSGFKVYELKKRCERLIERANYWSQLFFQEPYTWSLSEDVENLDFFIQPNNHTDTKPYPISSLSAGEFNRASRVLLFSQLELIPPNKKTNILFLDEIEGHLDAAGMTAFVEVVLPKLKERFSEYTIVIVSHQSALQNSGVIDDMWLVERQNRRTTLKICQLDRHFIN